MDILSFSKQELDMLLDKHPVVTKDYLIVTPVVTAVYELIRERVFMRFTGTFLYAAPRMGKTTCARATKKLLQLEFPDIYIMSFIAETYKKNSSALYVDILSASNYAVPNLARFKSTQMHLMRHIISSLEMKDRKQFVLIIDEMQNLSEEELNILAVMHNRLESNGVRMTTLGFCQPEILTLRSALQATRKDFLIARFLSEPIPFEGCISEGNLEKILFSYDEENFYPEGSHYSFTHFFLPRAFQNKFRLHHHASIIWSSLRNAAGRESVPMEHLSRTIEILLVSGRANDHEDYKITQEISDAAVRASNLQYFSGLIAQSDF